MECQKASVFSSRKLRSGQEFKGKKMYNDVFNGAAKLGSRVEDYREIFGGSAASSIPILDVPELNERMEVNPPSSRVDYSKIFGGYGEAEFAMPYEELFAKPKKARAPDEARLKYAEPEHSNLSGEKRVASPEASFHSKDDVKQFNVSYNKTGLDRGDNGTNGTTHVAKLHAMPAYTCLIDDTPPSRKNESGKPVHSVSIDTCLNSKFGEELRQWKPHSKAVSGPQPRMISAENSSSIHAKFQKNSTHNRSISHDISFDAFEIGLAVHSSERAPVPPPSGLSPNLVNNNHGGSSQSIKSNFWDARSDCFESGAAFLDEEIDTSSAAATSVAALRKAIEEAQAKIKIAKELMERRRSSNGLKAEKLSCSNISKAKNGVVKATEETKKSEETEALEVYQREDIQKQVDFSKHIAPETSQETSEIINERKSSSVLVEAKNTELKSTQMHHRLDQPEAGEVPKTFSELAYDGQIMATELKLEQVDNEIYKMPLANAVEWSKKMKIEENIEKPKEQNKTTKALKEDAKMYKFENELNPFKKLFEWNIFANIVKSAKELHHKNGNEEKVMVADEDEGAHHISKLSFEEVKSNPKKVHEPEEITQHEIPDLEDSIDMEEPKEFQNWVEFEKKQAEKYHEEDVKIGMDEVTMSADVVNWEKETEKGHEEARNDIVMGEGTEKKLTEDDKDGLIQDEEDCEKSMREDGKINGGDQLKEVRDIEKSLEDNILMNETEERGERVYEKVESERIKLEMQQSTEDEKNLETMQQAFGYNAISFEVVDVYDQDETEDVFRTHDAVGHERNLEGTEVTAGLMTMEEHEKEKDRSESYSPAVDQEDEMEEKESDDCTGLAQVFTGLQGINDQVDTSEILVIDKSGEYLGQIESNFEQKEKEDHMTGYTGLCSQEKDFTEMPCELDENCLDSEESDIVSNCEENEKNFIPIHSNIWLGNRIATENAFGTENCSQEVPCELGETHDNLNKSEDENCVDSEESDIVSNCEENEKNFIPIHSNIWLGNRIATENAFGTENCSQEVPCELGETHDDVNKSEVSASNKTDDTYFDSSPDRRQANAHIDAETSQKPCPLEQRETTTEISEEKKTNESSCEEGDDHDQMLTREEKEAEDNFQKEVKMEKESPKQKEAKNRDMEKEKERIAVERAIREARERAFAEAKERAGRAAAEKAAAATAAQKRVTSEARERLENPSTQANNKSTVEKASLEAKLKAERAAVERATAEARERALEKAMSEKARNKSDRSTSDKFSGASRDDGSTSEDQQKKGQVPSSSSYPSRGANDELDQRFKDTLERNQRRADRTAKALSEKNMRDLLVQKEQAERNRLAETLDAEVKRWSSGKERNLRALLSTLQYILGPDSGWKPIPLTDLVPTAAVKKAYRKATLFVHPDKLQQRGASIQQKYTCEKVFDLLKEAWNKFNSEEL